MTQWPSLTWRKTKCLITCMAIQDIKWPSFICHKDKMTTTHMAITQNDNQSHCIQITIAHTAHKLTTTLDSGSLFTTRKCLESGKHTNISKQQHWHTSTSIIRSIHPSAPPTPPTSTHLHAHIHIHTPAPARAHTHSCTCAYAPPLPHPHTLTLVDNVKTNYFKKEKEKRPT